MTWLTAVMIFIPFALLWNFLRRRHALIVEVNTEPRPLPISLSLIDWLKAFITWLFLFSRTFTIQPGVYYIGQYDLQSPLLVTGNFFLTNFLLYRRLKNRQVRLLVLNTEGINVWCSAGKGKFSAKEIIEKARTCNLLKEDQRLKVILPKFSLAGVKLAELKEAGISAAIGPLYAEDLPDYLDSGRLNTERKKGVQFGFRHRLYTAVPTAMQFFYYFLGLYVLSLGWINQIFVWTAVGLAFFYPLLFPYLPGKLFATKGILLGLGAVLVFLVFGPWQVNSGLFWSLAAYNLATAMFVGLSYTGNSPISNYTSVRQEIAKFLPVLAVLYLLSLVFYII